MTRMLVLGGTQWLGREIAERHVATGADVVALARGSAAGGEAGDAPEHVTFISADRDDPHAYDALLGDFDEVVDVTRIPRHAHGALAALADRARHWTFVSSVSAQRLEAPPGADEDDDLVPADESGDDYGGAKVAIEQAVTAALGDRAAIVRPGLVGGPGDPSDRFGYWVARAAVAGREPMLVPARDQPVQVIDVRDLADFIVAGAGTGIVNAIGAHHRLHEVVEVARSIAGYRGEVVLASDEDLDAHDVGVWAGPRALPLRLPAELENHSARSNERYLAAGGTHRALADMLADTLVDERARGLGRVRATGLTRADEVQILSALAAR